MTGSHEPFSVATDDGEVVVSVFNIDLYESARIRLDPEEAVASAAKLREAAESLRDDARPSGPEPDEETEDVRTSEMGVPRGGPSTALFVNDA